MAIDEATQAEINKILDERMVEERKKLAEEYAKKDVEYDKRLKDTVSKVKEQLREDLEKSKTELHKKTEEVEKFKQELESVKKDSTSTEEEKEEAKKLLEKKESLLAEAESRTQKLLEGLSQQFTEKLRKKDIEVYRSNKIAEAQGEIIAELVKGETIEEIDKAFEDAKARYTDIATRATKKNEEEALKNGKTPGMTGPANNNTSARNVGSFLTMEKKDFDSAFENILKEYSQSIGRS